jgi:alkylated DNA repair protein alkB family protein 1
MSEARFAWHGVPKILPNTCPTHLANWPNDPVLDELLPQWEGWMKNKRINLNVRQIY